MACIGLRRVGALSVVRAEPRRLPPSENSHLRAGPDPPRPRLVLGDMVLLATFPGRWSPRRRSFFRSRVSDVYYHLQTFVSPLRVTT